VTEPQARVTGGQVVDGSPIINDAFSAPSQHWEFSTDGPPKLVSGRRPAGYLPPDPSGRGVLDVTADTIPLDLVNDLRERLHAWRQDDYVGASEVTRALLAHWFESDRESGLRPFFAQREALETLVFLVEAPADRRVGIDVPRVEAYQRWCTKMATGTGKTLVMAMTIAWCVLNKAASRTDNRFTDAVLVVCPNLTVKERLAGLDPHRPGNEYESFGLVPPHLSGLLGQAKLMVTNWHQLTPDTDPKRSVLKRGPESDAAFCRRVIGPGLGNKHRILVINDEAHHAYRFAEAPAQRGEAAQEAEQATVWIDGLARIHRDREILRCHDFSATPVYPSGSGKPAGSLFEWIISDFSLVDAIEAGLTKIPRIPTDDNAGASVPRYRNLWQHVRDALPRGEQDATERGSSLTDYLTRIDGPLKQLAGEWEETLEQWRDVGRAVPPAMIVICNDTALAGVLEQHIAVRGSASPGLVNTPTATRTLRIDSRLLKQAEDRDEVGTASDNAERIRKTVATVGKIGEPGQEIRCVISVAMLSEGWDARNVTQILGLRAFTSQLLCEQVVGRGLRRSSHDDLTVPEYVDVYGVPFQMLPFAKGGGGKASPPPRTTSVVAQRDRRELEIRFPRVVSIVNDVGQTLVVDRDALVGVRVEPTNDPTVTRVVGVGSVTVDDQDRQRTWNSYRRQRLIFELAARVLQGQAGAEHLFPQAIKEITWVLDNKVQLAAGIPEGELDNEFYRTLLVQRIRDQLRPGVQHPEALLPVLDEYQPEGSTGQVSFLTSKTVEPAIKSHLNYVVCDSELERQIAQALESNDQVEAYVKNDHLFFELPYRFDGRTLRYVPDFIVRLHGGAMLIVEGKGQATTRDASKESAARRWIAAVNADQRWGLWSYHVAHSVADVAAAIDSRNDPKVAQAPPGQ